MFETVASASSATPARVPRVIVAPAARTADVASADFGTAGWLGREPGLGFLRTVSQALDGSTIGQFLIKTTVPFALAVF